MAVQTPASTKVLQDQPLPTHTIQQPHQRHLYPGILPPVCLAIRASQTRAVQAPCVFHSRVSPSASVLTAWLATLTQPTAVLWPIRVNPILAARLLCVSPRKAGRCASVQTDCSPTHLQRCVAAGLFHLHHNEKLLTLAVRRHVDQARRVPPTAMATPSVGV